jgi:hypothetical protein
MERESFAEAPPIPAEQPFIMRFSVGNSNEKVIDKNPSKESLS